MKIRLGVNDILECHCLQQIALDCFLRYAAIHVLIWFNLFQTSLEEENYHYQWKYVQVKNGCEDPNVTNILKVDFIILEGMDKSLFLNQQYSDRRRI